MGGKTRQEIAQDEKREREWRAFLIQFDEYAKENGFKTHAELSATDQQVVWYNWWMA